MDDEKFINLMEYVKFTNNKYNYKIIGAFKKDFWKEFDYKTISDKHDKTKKKLKLKIKPKPGGGRVKKTRKKRKKLIRKRTSKKKN